MNGLSVWIKRFRELEQPFDLTGEQSGRSAEQIELELELSKRFNKFRTKVDRINLADAAAAEAAAEAAAAESVPMPFRSARTHWFDGQQAYHPRHDGKGFQVASDTWNRLNSALTEIKSRVARKQV